MSFIRDPFVFGFITIKKFKIVTKFKPATISKNKQYFQSELVKNNPFRVF